MPKKWEISPNRKRQEQYEMMWQWLTYERFADRWRKKMKREEAKLEKERNRKIFDTMQKEDQECVKEHYSRLQERLDPVTRIPFSNTRILNREWYSLPEVNMTEITPPIEPTVPEKKKFLTPEWFDAILWWVILWLSTWLWTSYRIPVFM